MTCPDCNNLRNDIAKDPLVKLFGELFSTEDKWVDDAVFNGSLKDKDDGLQIREDERRGK